MSTSITNVWRCEDHTLSSLFLLAQSWKKELKVLAKKTYLDFLAQDSTHHIDMLVLNRAGLLEMDEYEALTQKSLSAFDFVMETLTLLRKEPGPSHPHALNFGTELVFFQDSNQTPLVMYYCQNAEISDFLNKKLNNLGQSFEYWNNTDTPDEISQDEWDARGEVWNEIFEDSSIPSEVGLVVKLLPDYYSPGIPSVDELEKNQPSFESRVKDKLKSLACEKMMKEDIEKNSSHTKSELTWFAAFQKFKKGQWKDDSRLEDKIRKALWPTIPAEAYKAKDLTPFYAQFEKISLNTHLAINQAKGPSKVRI